MPPNGNPQNGRIAIPCEWCGDLFLVWPYQSTRKYCSKAHRLLAMANPPARRWCEQCGQAFPFRPSPSAVARGFGRFCDRVCAARWQQLHRDQRGAANPWWKGDAAARRTGHSRARSLYPTLGACEECGLVPAVERHHRNGDTLDNRRANVALLCDRCHTRTHHLAAVCKRGHPFDEANTYYDRNGHKSCRVCRAALARAYRARRRQPGMRQSGPQTSPFGP